ncbi:MAG TPA: hypothetical protein VNA28_16285, partial [Solirubrobacteraceae bacterium]|nr:hypothetical protein [Solirubrobacteraceae bacterium]
MKMAIAVDCSCLVNHSRCSLQHMDAPMAGLCESCRHQQVVRNTRGSSFSLCRRSREDDRYPRYPRLPVVRCP